MASKNKGTKAGTGPAQRLGAGDALKYTTTNYGGMNPADTGDMRDTFNATLLQLDMATDTIGPILEKVTNGYFTGNVGQLNATSMNTASLSDSNDTYYVDVLDNATTSASVATQFSLTYGHYAGSGSNTGESNQEYGATQAIYGQLSSMLLPESQITGGFMINSATTREDFVYALIAERSLMKDKLNKKQWTMALNGSSGSYVAGGAATATNTDGGSRQLLLTDDSNDIPGVATPGGMRYNIVEGSAGVVTTPAATTTYGWFYPELGIMLMSGTSLSASIPGVHASSSAAGATDVVPYYNPIQKAAGGAAGSGSGVYGFAPSLSSTKNQFNMMRFYNALSNPGGSPSAHKGGGAGGYLKLRNEEDQYSRHYFVRATANNFNFSNNPTFVSGSSNRLKYDYMLQNPQVFITGVGLFDTAGNLVAVAKLSTPVQKNFQSEATIKVKLTY